MQGFLKFQEWIVRQLSNSLALLLKSGILRLLHTIPCVNWDHVGKKFGQLDGKVLKFIQLFPNNLIVYSVKRTWET